MWFTHALIFVLYYERHMGTRFNAALGTMVCVLTGFELGTPEYNYIPHTWCISCISSTRAAFHSHLVVFASIILITFDE
jgi:hypothetical protein